MLTKRTFKIEGLSWIGIGVIICFLAWKVHLGSFQEPGPGFVAFASVLFISIVGLIMVFSQTLSKISQGDSLDLGLGFRYISLPRLGYTMLLLFVHLRGIESFRRAKNEQGRGGPIKRQSHFSPCLKKFFEQT